MKRKSSILARPSPRHTLLPERESKHYQNGLTDDSFEDNNYIPAEKGIKASLLTNFPLSSRKWAGLKVWGLSHSLSSCRTDVSRGITLVPCTTERMLN